MYNKLRWKDTISVTNIFFTQKITGTKLTSSLQKSWVNYLLIRKYASFWNFQHKISSCSAKGLSDRRKKRGSDNNTLFKTVYCNTNNLTPKLRRITLQKAFAVILIEITCLLVQNCFFNSEPYHLPPANEEVITEQICNSDKSTNITIVTSA